MQVNCEHFRGGTALHKERDPLQPDNYAGAAEAEAECTAYK